MPQAIQKQEKLCSHIAYRRKTNKLMSKHQKQKIKMKILQFLPRKFYFCTIFLAIYEIFSAIRIAVYALNVNMDSRKRNVKIIRIAEIVIPNFFKPSTINRSGNTQVYSKNKLLDGNLFVTNYPYFLIMCSFRSLFLLFIQLFCFSIFSICFFFIYCLEIAAGNVRNEIV